MSTLEVSHLTKIYGDNENKIIATDHLSFTVQSGEFVAVVGRSGAGKTTFVSGVLKELGYLDHVVSPTFNILKCYFEVNPIVYHIDAYRLEDQNIDIGLEEYIEGNGICFIEWPKFIEPLIPNKHLEISLKRINDNEREIIITDNNDFYKDLFKSLEV